MPCHLPDRRGPNDDAEGRGHRLQRSAAQQGRPGGQRGRGPRRLTAAAAPPGPWEALKAEPLAARSARGEKATRGGALLPPRAKTSADRTGWNQHGCRQTNGSELALLDMQSYFAAVRNGTPSSSTQTHPGSLATAITTPYPRTLQGPDGTLRPSTSRVQ